MSPFIEPGPFKKAFTESFDAALGRPADKQKPENEDEDEATAKAKPAKSPVKGE